MLSFVCSLIYGLGQIPDLLSVYLKHQSGTRNDTKGSNDSNSSFLETKRSDLAGTACRAGSSSTSRAVTRSRTGGGSSRRGIARSSGSGAASGRSSRAGTAGRRTGSGAGARCDDAGDGLVAVGVGFIPCGVTVRGDESGVVEVTGESTAFGFSDVVEGVNVVHAGTG